MFIVDLSTRIPIAKHQIAQAYPNIQASYPDICIANTDSGNGILLNSIMLREALLSSKDFLQKYLGLVVEEYKEPEKPQPKKSVKKTIKIITDGDILE